MYLEETSVEADLMEFYASDDYTAAMEILASDETRPRAVAEARDVDIGINVTWYGGKDHVDGAFFLNQIKGATGWLVPAVPDAPLEFDENGYVTALPDGMSVISRILNRDPYLADITPFSGTFRIYGQGEGTVTVSHETYGDLIDEMHTLRMPTEVIDGQSFWYADIDYDPGSGKNVIFQILDMDGKNYIHDLALVHHDHLDHHRAGELFNPDLIADLAPYETLRFLTWMKANQYEQAEDGTSADPERRYLSPDHYNFNTRHGMGGKVDRENYFLSSAPFEHIIALANETDSNAWVNLPVDITDARVAWMADYAAANLDDGLEITWEYGNELWSGARGFMSSQYAQTMAERTFGIEGWSGIVEWDAYRGPQIFDIIAQSSPEAREMSRYVATVWGFHSPTTNGEELAYAYANRYFEAAAAQAMDDAPSRPQDIVTDYSHGLYFGGLTEGSRDDAVGVHIIEAYDTDSARAEAITRWLLFGADPAHRIDLGPAALDAPVEGVVYRPGLAIAALDLVLADIQDGLDPLRELDTVLWLDGDTLFYRGVNADDWTPVLTFETAPDKTLAEMLHDVEVVGYGSVLGGVWRTGLYSGLAQQAELTLEGHAPIAEKFGLTWSGYEGGPHLWNPPVGGEGMFQVFSDDGWATLVQDVWFDMLDAYGVDKYLHYKAHSRFVELNDWGAQRYVGQDIDEAPKAAYLLDTIEFSGLDPTVPQLPEEPRPPLPGNNTLPVIPLRAPAWHTLDADWAVATDTSWVSTGPGKLLLEPTAAVSTETSYTVTLDVSGAAEGLEIRAYAVGGGERAQEIARTKATGTGGTVTLDLGQLTAERDRMRVELHRTDAASGPLEVSNIVIHESDLQPTSRTEVAKDVTAPIKPVALPPSWQQTDAGLSNAQPSWDKAVFETGRLLGHVDRAYQLDLDISQLAPLPDPGRLRIAVFAVGGGSTHLFNTVVDLSHTGLHTIDLGVMPSDRSMYRVTLQRLDGEGEIGLTDLRIGTQNLTPTLV